MRLKDKVALITGGGAGIGRATAERFAKEGAKLVLLELNEEAAADAEKSMAGDVRVVVGSASDEASVTRSVDTALESFGALDILVNNAYACRGDTVLDIEPELWARNIEGSLNTTYLCSRAALPHMIRRGGGAIVNVSSVNALMSFGESAYSAAKAGVIALTKTMAVDYGPENIRVNAICPGTIATDAWKKVSATDPTVFERLGKLYPLRRVGRPEEIANVALFLASDESSFVTGSVIVADGGVTAGHVAFLDAAQAVT